MVRAATTSTHGGANQNSPLCDVVVENIVGVNDYSPTMNTLRIGANPEFAILRLIANIDRVVSEQVSAIIHHPRFEQLEASWRSLLYLVAQAYKQPSVKIRILDLSRKELVTDLRQSLEFDQSQLFNKIYSEEFGMPGGKPYGVLLGDYEFSNHPEDIATLEAMSQVAAASFAPFIAAASGQMFNIDHITDLTKQPKLDVIFKQPQYLRWNSFRKQEDTRFVGLTLPHFLVRDAYARSGFTGGFLFADTKPECGQLWGNACYAFGAVLIQAFLNDHWLGDIRGFSASGEGGMVPDYVMPEFATDKFGLMPKINTDVFLTDSQEKQLTDLGFIPLCQAYGSDAAVFYSNASIQQSMVYNNTAATQNAATATMLQHIFCASRFAHYLKVIGRDKVGSFVSAQEHESYLNNWLGNYIVTNADASPSIRRRYPLQEAKVQVKEKIGKPGSYMCVIHLKPRFQLEQVVTNLTLVTELVSVVNT